MGKARVGLILTGGGARAAYQVGVLKAIAELLPRRSHNPFMVICGTSAGALNAAALAINAQNFRRGVGYLNTIWKNFHPNQIYRTDLLGVFNNSVLWFSGLLLAGFGIGKTKQIALFDNSPLLELLEEMLPCEKIQSSIDQGLLHALSITASGYSSGQSVTFYQGNKLLTPWQRTRRIGVSTQIGIKHLLASSALPFFFPAVPINREYFGDGSMRQIAPISSALHLGATRVLVIGVNSPTPDHVAARVDLNTYPSLAQIGGHALNSIFHDSMEVDLERVRHVNRLVALMPEEIRQQTNLKHIDVLSILPSQSIDKIAARHIKDLPWTIRLLLKLVGAGKNSGATLVSYLLSEKKFCSALIELGYQDALLQREAIIDFLDTSTSLPSELSQ